MSSFLQGYLRGRVLSLEDTIEDWRVHSNGLENTIANLRKTIGDWKKHAEGLKSSYDKLYRTTSMIEKERDDLRKEVADLKKKYAKTHHTFGIVAKGATAQVTYLTELLDEAHGGADNNPARQTSETSLVGLFGDAKNRKLDHLSSVYMRGLRQALSDSPEAVKIDDVRSLGKYDHYRDPLE